jgi:diguanylate cyclase (GGDEF)-like protein
MAKLLIIEDSPMIQKIIRFVASSELHCDFDIASDLAQAKTLIECNDYYLALADLNLPDAPNGEIVDLTLNFGIATIVLTASLDEDKRVLMLKKGVLDYIFKENRDSYYHAIKLANQILNNREITVLLADDSKTLRAHIRKHLKKLLFNVVEVIDGVEAMFALQLNPKIELLITDFNMPRMNGIELIRQVRKTRSRDDFPIIGLSSSNDPTLSAQFIKHGANDFLVTPFIHEEFQWRILKTMEQIQLIKKITDSANRDYLTKLYNRRYFYTQAKKIYTKNAAAKQPIIVALIDVDFFKKVNDEYGHDSGDAVLITLSTLLTNSFKGHIVARYGGEEFIVLIDNCNLQQATAQLESFRSNVQAALFTIPDGSINVTVSIGAAIQGVNPLDKLISTADEALYKAKETGRNKLIVYQ